MKQVKHSVIDRLGLPRAACYCIHPRATILAMVVACLGTALSPSALAQSRPDKMLATEQALLESLSAMAVADSLPKTAPAGPSPDVATLVNVASNSSTASAVSAATAVSAQGVGDSAPPVRPIAGSASVIQAVAVSTESVAAERRQPSDTTPRPAAIAAKKDTRAIAPTVQEAAKAPPAKGVRPQGLSLLETTNADLRRELHTKNQQLESLQKEVIELRSQLSMAEVEVNRLSSIMDAKTRASLGQYSIQTPKRSDTATYSGEPQAARPQAAVSAPVSDVRPPSPEAALQVATIAVSKADLRLGPGTNHSPLMPLPRGSRLTVETRQGEWLRVFAPSGERAWIHASLVTFGDSAGSANSRSAVAVKGFDANAEEEAFRRLQRGASQK